MAMTGMQMQEQFPLHRMIDMNRFAAFVLILLLTACSTRQEVRRDAAPLPLIPMPAAVERESGDFQLRRGMPIVVQSGNAQALGAARYFQHLAGDLHLDLRIDAAATDNAIVFALDPNQLLRDDAGGEGYELSISPRRVRVSARSPQGLFYGGITLWQLISAAETPRIPALAISDHPRFAWRGLLLDSARHFQSPEFVKRFIDQMAQHKLNVLHWHLTDDQG